MIRRVQIPQIAFFAHASYPNLQMTFAPTIAPSIITANIGG
jgi:hypothetical protein